MTEKRLNQIVILLILGCIFFLNLHILKIETANIRMIKMIGDNKEYSDQQTERINEIVRFINDGK